MDRRLQAGFVPCALLVLFATQAGAANQVEAVKLRYQEIEQGVEPYEVVYTVSDDFIRVDDDSDSSGYIVFDRDKSKVYSVSHYNKSILVVPKYPDKSFDPDFELVVEFQALDDVPPISGKKVHNYRVRAVTDGSSETCMDIQLVPGLLPEAAKSLQAFQTIMSGLHSSTLENTPEEFRTPCYLVDQIYNKGDYYQKGLPIQEWHSNQRVRQLVNFENTSVDVSIFDIPPDYRQYSLKGDGD